MIPVSHALCANGHVASTNELLRAGVAAEQIRAAVSAGAIIRPLRGHYVCAHADADRRLAASIPARISCISVLAMAGVWAGTDTTLHLQRAPHAHGSALLTSAGAGAGAPTLHWSEPRFRDHRERSWIVSPMGAVWQSIHCLDEEHAIACLESAVHEQLLTRGEVRQICRLAPRRLEAGIRELEFTADSGQETIVRRRLRHRGFRVMAQVPVGPYSEDLIVDDCVAIETDGKKWHGADRFQPDRTRDAYCEGLGLRTLRLTQHMILREWDSTLSTIERMVRDAEPERRRRGFRPRAEAAASA